MADEARECTLGPWELKLVSIGNEISHAIAETIYPYKNGAELEDLGVNPEIYRFSAVIDNEDYRNNYQLLRNWFLSQFTEPIELIHPDHGVLVGYPKNVSFSSDRRRDFAQFDFDFEIANIQEDVQDYTDPLEVAEAETVALNAEVQASVAESMQQAGVPDVEGDDWSLLDVWNSLGDAAREFASGAQSALSKIQGVIATVKAPVDAINSTIVYAGTLSGKLTESVQKCCDSFTALMRNVSSTSSGLVATLASNLSGQMTALSDAPLALRRAFATLAASTLATETARLISDDEKRMGESIAQEKVVSDDAEGRQIAEDNEPFMTTPDDLEKAIAICRSFIDEVLPLVVSPYRLKKQAANLTDAALRIKMVFMTTKTVRIEHETPVHKVCLDNGLSYKAADRICALNGVVNPTFMSGEVLVYES